MNKPPSGKPGAVHFLQILNAVEASAIPKLITPTTSPVMRKELKPVVGRADVLMLVIGFELRFERS